MGDPSANKPKPPKWTLKTENVGDAIKVARYLAVVQRINAIHIVEALSKSCDLVIDGSFIVLPGTHIVWEASDTPDTISAPVLLFHVLMVQPVHVHISYIWSLAGRSPLNIVQAAFPIVAEWFRDVTLNPPLIDSALRFGRGCVQRVIAYAASRLRILCRTYR